MRQGYMLLSFLLFVYWGTSLQAMEIGLAGAKFGTLSKIGDLAVIRSAPSEAPTIAEEGPAADLEVVVQAESGSSAVEDGLSYALQSDAWGNEYLTVDAPQAQGDFPGDEGHTITYELTFPAAGEYELYIRNRVGEGAANDDSFFYGRGFGEKDIMAGGDWVIVNNIAGSGFIEDEDVVTGEGTAGAMVWKWTNLSQFAGHGAGISFVVPDGELTQKFQIGTREDGFEIDMFIFAPIANAYTVGQLNTLGSVKLEPVVELSPPLADGLDKWLGNVHSGSQAKDFEGFWNQVTPENAGKWGSVEVARDVYNWSGLDAAYDFAKENGFPFRFHVLIWGAQQPSWMIGLPEEEQLEEIKEWMDTVSKRYPDVDYVEVVNEPLHDPPVQTQNDIDEGRTDYGGYINALGGQGAGANETDPAVRWAWIVKAFELADTYFPNTALYINDYNIIGSTPNTAKYLEIINLLKNHEGGSLIDGIGFQAHAFSTRHANVATLRANLASLAQTGLDIQVTEMDIDGEEDHIQLAEYKRIFPIFWENESVVGITLWGYRTGLWRAAAYLIDAQGRERMALQYLRAYVQDNYVPVTGIQITAPSETIEPGSTLQLTATLSEGATFDTVTWSLSNSLATIDQNGLLTAVGEGTVNVTATAIDGNVSNSKTILIKSSEVPTGIAPNPDELFKIYPNPTRGKISLSGIQKNSQVKIFDMSGKLVAELDVNNRSSVEVSLNVPAGIYILQLFDAEHYVYRKLLVN